MYEEVLDILRINNICGASVYRGIAGYGAGSVIHTQKLLELTHDLPVVVEAVDLSKKIEKILPLLDDILTGGLVTVQPVRAIRYNRAAR